MYSHCDPAALQPTKSQFLARHLYNWWWTRGQLHFQYSPWLGHSPWLTTIPSHQEQVQAIAAEFAQDAGLAQIELCTFLGRSEGKLIATAVEAAIPEPCRLVVEEALTLICQQRGAGRRALVGVGVFAGFMALIALLGTIAE